MAPNMCPYFKLLRRKKKQFIYTSIHPQIYPYNGKKNLKTSLNRCKINHVDKFEGVSSCSIPSEDLKKI